MSEADSKPLPGCVKMLLVALILFGGLIFVFAVFSVAARLPQESDLAPKQAPKPMQAEEVREACALLKALYSRRLISEIPIGEIDNINACRTLGYW